MIKLKKIVERVLKEEDPDWDLYDDLEETKNWVLSDFASRKRTKRKTQAWKLIKFNRLKKIWEDFAKYQGVRDERGLDEIIEQLKINFLKIYVNTELMGHTQADPTEDFKEYGMTEKDENEFGDYAVDDNGEWRISDYAITPMFNLLLKIRKADTPEDRLVYADQMLNVAHQRSDLASWFVEGGSSSLYKLSGIGEEEDE